LEGLELEVGDVAGPPLALLSLPVPGLRSLLHLPYELALLTPDAVLLQRKFSHWIAGRCGVRLS
jgi:hypothetical protein